VRHKGKKMNRGDMKNQSKNLECLGSSHDGVRQIDKEKGRVLRFLCSSRVLKTNMCFDAYIFSPPRDTRCILCHLIALIRLITCSGLFV
jgi:hypothetical protein